MGLSRQLIQCERLSSVSTCSQVNRPAINGLENFTKNPILHTAEWPKDLDYKTAFKDEKVAVIGIGSSGVQTIGAITPYSKAVNVFARSPFWISPPFVTAAAGERDWKMGNFACKSTFRSFYQRLIERNHRFGGGARALPY